MNEMKKLAATIDFKIDGQTTLSNLKYAKDCVKALKKSQMKDYFAEDVISWVGDELRENADLLGEFDKYSTTIVLSRDPEVLVNDETFGNCLVFIGVKVFVERVPVRLCGSCFDLRSTIEYGDYYERKNVFGYERTFCYDVEIDFNDGRVNETTRRQPTLSVTK